MVESLDKALVDRIPNSETVRARLGVLLQSLPGTEEPGVLVIRVQPDSPAQRMGLEPGDRIVRFGATAIGSSDLDLYRLLGLIHRAGPDARVRLGVMRGQQKLEVEGVLGRVQ